ncbi:MAG: glycerol-3-phosphate 1-O-acyltransferase PlsY [Verrucomicrobia bacterium]|nr:glycerol-3-phosphate 1-O-acyltransferase PlsY [Verrucomicrobiota bacterium]
MFSLQLHLTRVILDKSYDLLLPMLPTTYHLQPITFLALAAYLIGSFPAGYLIGRCCGIDIRQHGSGNIGATNVVRVLGKKWGALVFTIDFLKGLIPVVVAMSWSHAVGIVPASAPGAVAALMALLGHSFPVWLEFRGGKGISTSAGIIVGLFPGAFPFCIGSWLLIFYTTGYVSLASLIGAAMLPVTVAFFYFLGPRYDSPSWMGADWLSLVLAFLMASVVIWRHRGNLKRLSEGTEPSFKKKN